MTDTAFPQNVVSALYTCLVARLPDHNVFTRPVRTSDQNLACGVYANDWMPVEGSTEMPSQEPTLNRYTFKVQNLVVSMDEEVGRALFAVNAKIVRAVLVRDPQLQVDLRGLQETVLQVTERFQRFGVAKQSYLSGGVRGKWTYLATTDVWIETETVPSQ